MKINRYDQAKILSPQEIAWLFDGKVELVSDLKLFRLLAWFRGVKEMEAIASLSLLSYIEGLPTERDRALFGICLYTTRGLMRHVRCIPLMCVGQMGGCAIASPF